jgi:hypothetical protein
MQCIFRITLSLLCTAFTSRGGEAHTLTRISAPDLPRMGSLYLSKASKAMLKDTYWSSAHRQHPYFPGVCHVVSNEISQVLSFHRTAIVSMCRMQNRRCNPFLLRLYRTRMLPLPAMMQTVLFFSGHSNTHNFVPSLGLSKLYSIDVTKLVPTTPCGQNEYDSSIDVRSTRTSEVR